MQAVRKTASDEYRGRKTSSGSKGLFCSSTTEPH